MHKIFLTCRDRLFITKKCIQSLYKHSSLKFQLHVYVNQTEHEIDETFDFFSKSIP